MRTLVDWGCFCNKVELYSLQVIGLESNYAVFMLFVTCLTLAFGTLPPTFSGACTCLNRLWAATSRLHISKQLTHTMVHFHVSTHLTHSHRRYVLGLKYTRMPHSYRKFFTCRTTLNTPTPISYSPDTTLFFVETYSQL
jgi:hypothetical protein